jgi:uncharacterized membrane protein (Fun14 family)
METITDPTFLWSLGGGALAGVAVGVALRSAAKLALLLTGTLILVMAGLVNAGLITVDWTAVSTSLESGAEAAGGFVQFALADLSAQLAGFSAGVLLGFKFR